jgi:hypothetical protein
MKRHGSGLFFGLLLLLPLPARAAENAAPTLKNDIQPIFDRACSSCHGVDHQRSKLNLSLATAAGALVGTPSDEVPQMVRVKPGDPGASYLWQKLQNTAPKGKGMPRGIFSSKRLPEAELDLIKKWIEAGAL